MTDEGKLLFNVSAEQLKCDNKYYELVMYWHPNHKIYAVKVIRDISSPPMGLKEAKDLVESNPNGVPFGKFRKAEQWRARLDANLECSIRVKVN